MFAELRAKSDSGWMKKAVKTWIILMVRRFYCYMIVADQTKKLSSTHGVKKKRSNHNTHFNAKGYKTCRDTES